MKTFKLLLAAGLVMLSASFTAQAQFNLNSLKQKAENAAKKAISGQTSTATSTSSSPREVLSNKAASAVPAAKGRTLYVSVSTGSARADGLSPTSALRDLQKAIDVAEENDVILVAEGNYHGNLDRGYIECGRFGNASQKEDMGKFISIYGGYSTDFSKRDVIKYVTKLQPVEHTFIAPLFNFNARRPYGYTGPQGNVVIDGLVFDFGENNLYCGADVNDERTGTPNEGVLTGRFIEPGASPATVKVGYANGDEYALHLDVEGNVVLFTWTRTKTFEDMGQGFRFMNGIRTINVHNNIFGCNSNCAVERCRYESNKADEAAKISNLYDNYFFANKRDLEIASAGKSSISVPAARIEEAEQIGPKYEGNRELPESEKAFVEAIDQPYLQGFLSLKIMSSQSYDANSAANQVNRLFGLNQQGSEIVRPSMYCNKYPWEKAKDLFGVVKGYGAQIPQ